MRYLSHEAKITIVEKAIARNGQGIAEIAAFHNIGLSTLERWMNQFRNGKLIGSAPVPLSNLQLTQSEKLEHLLLTANLDEIELGAYCRERGLYSFQIPQWKNEIMSQDNSQKKQENQSELKALKEENKQLKQELRRKEKALAEAAALLILKKKADLLWGDPEDE